MISYDEALALTIASAKRTKPETLPLSEAVGRVLAEDLIARFPIPRFDNSAVDGYAVVEPVGTTALMVVRTIGAGESPGSALKPGECARILTGAPTPENTFGVAMQEDTTQVHEGVRMCKDVRPGQNVRRAGEEFLAGARALLAGVPLNAAGIAAAAAMGYTAVSVFRAPRVGIVVTGAELVAPSEKLGESQIYESNSYALSAALHALGITPAFVEVISDDRDLTLITLRDALSRCDVLITTGGVSVGDRDVVKDALESLQVKKVYWSIALKPGKPVYFGMRGEKAVFGLPGNPMSVLATFVLLVQPYVKGMMGFQRPGPSRWQARLLQAVRHKPGRREFVPGSIFVQPDGIAVLPTLHQGSHMLGGMARADAIIDIPDDVSEVAEGELVWVLPFGQVTV